MATGCTVLLAYFVYLTALTLLGASTASKRSEDLAFDKIHAWVPLTLGILIPMGILILSTV